MDNRLIIVMGMAHSGTRIFCKTLLQSTKIKLLVSGTESYLMETDYLLHQNANGINKVLLATDSFYILVKRPWTEQYWDFYKSSFPNANYFIMLKSFDDQSISWCKPTSLIAPDLRSSIEMQKKVYSEHRNWAQNFPLPRKIINYNELLNTPARVFEEINQQLNLQQNFVFNEIDIYRRNNENLAAIRRRQGQKRY